ncbi:MAG: hypothetical protein HQ472_08165 [Ignavibacteria bacterium]|nr:hypothetical protein [Ignavibacteria bacterium]
MATKKGKATVVPSRGKPVIHKGYIPGEHVIVPTLVRVDSNGSAKPTKRKNVGSAEK